MSHHYAHLQIIHQKIKLIRHQQTEHQDWATGTIAFKDGQSQTEIRVPLDEVPNCEYEKFKSYFYVYIIDQHKHKRMTKIKCDFTDDRGKSHHFFQPSTNLKSPFILSDSF